MASVVGLFAGIGGIELGLQPAGFEAELLCEFEPAAQAVLRKRFDGIPVHDDVRTLRHIPTAEILAAGFPCQDLSQAGRKVGIEGDRSSLVSEVFRLCRLRAARPRWIVIENVSYMLALGGGEAMEYVTASLERLGYAWAYRVVDARAFGVPQRRQRVLFVASRTDDPREVLFADDASAEDLADPIGVAPSDGAHGFYWTEGLRGLGWALDAVPTIKGGSSLGIPSAPAVWQPQMDFVGTPELRDCERLQGFDEDWTAAADEGHHAKNARWRLVGNAVCVPMASWLGFRLRTPGPCVVEEYAFPVGKTWPPAAFGARGVRVAMRASLRPIGAPRPRLSAFLRYPLKPLSAKASAGFLSRARAGRLRFPDGFLDSFDRHLATVRESSGRSLLVGATT